MHFEIYTALITVRDH